MHDLTDESNQIDQLVVESPELLGIECATCYKILAYRFFDRDSSYKTGYYPQCRDCRSQPRLSLDEHTARLEEMNRNSHAVKRQKRAHQDDYRDESPRYGRQLHTSDFLNRIKKYIPNLYLTSGNIAGDLALFLVYPCPQLRLDGRDYEYLMFIPLGLLNEYSTYEFTDKTDILVKEKDWADNGLPGRGWRTPLLRFIKRGLITQEQADLEFGEAVGPGSTVWYRTLYQYRNAVTA